MNIGNPGELSVLELAERWSGTRPGRVADRVRPAARRTTRCVRRPDITLARAVLGLEADGRPGARACGRTVEWFRDHPDLLPADR